jgi:large subunit ribosomal protein L17
MRHRKKGRVLGRSPSHRRALYRNLASALFLTEGEFTELHDNAPKVPGRIITTLAKAKEVRPMVERCISIAKRSMQSAAEAERFAAPAERGSDAWKKWREGPQYAQWVAHRGPVVTARRRVLQMLGDKAAMKICFDVVAPRFADRSGGYTRVARLAKPRLGDAGTRAILEFVGRNDRVRAKAQRPAFASNDNPSTEG